MGHIREYTTRKGEKRYEAVVKHNNRKMSRAFPTQEEAEEFIEEEEEFNRRVDQEAPGMSIREIAAKLGVDPATVRYHLQKAEAKLRKHKGLRQYFSCG